MALSSRNSAFLAAQLLFEAFAAASGARPRRAERGLWRPRFDGFVPVAHGSRAGRRLGARLKGSCLLPPVKNIEDRTNKQWRRSSGTGAAAKEGDGSRSPADAEMQRFDGGRGIETEVRGNIGEPLRAASLAAGKKAEKAGEIFRAAQMQQAFAGENQLVRVRRMLAPHRHNWHMGSKPGRQDGQNIRDVLPGQPGRAAKPGHATLSFLRQHGSPVTKSSRCDRRAPAASFSR